MEYKFYKKTITTTKSEYFLVETSEKYDILLNFIFTVENYSQIQTIIDGIGSSKTKEKGEEYYWGNEDVDVYANKNGILLIDKMSQRGGIHDPDIITLRLTHQEMIQFLQDFKTFIEENS